MDKNISKSLNMNGIDMMGIQEQYLKMFKKANRAKKFELKCWIDFCQKNHEVEFKEFLASQSYHNFLDKLNCGFIDISDVGTYEEIINDLKIEFHLI